VNTYYKNIDKLVIGISQQSFVEDLLREGYKNFFFGFLPQEYLEKYGTQISLNRRYYLQEQFTDYETALKIIEKIHKKDGKIHLTLNPIQINKTMFEHIKTLIQSFKDQIDGFIISNISVLEYLNSIGYRNIILSNLFGFYSIEAVKFFTDRFSIQRVVLPRDIKLSFIKEVAKTFPDLEIEVFLYGDNCMFSEAFCFAEHGFSHQPAPLCSYSLNNAVPIKKPQPDFKFRILNNEEDLQNFKTEYLDIDSLLERLYIAYNNGDNDKLKNILNKIKKYDTEYLSKYYHKLKFALNFLNNKEAKEILSKLEPKEEDSYTQFHKLNLSAIEKIINELKDFPNIFFKIPARGRNFKLKIADYNYKESQYKL